MLNSCLHSLTSSGYDSKQLSLSPVTTPSKVITDSNYVGSLSELEGFHVLDFKTENIVDIDIKYDKVFSINVYIIIIFYKILDHCQDQKR